MFLQVKSVLVVCVVIVSLGGILETASAQTEANKAVIDRWLVLWTTVDLTIAEEIFAPHFVSHIPHYPEATDLEGYKAEVAKTPTYVTGFQLTLDDIIAEDDKVAGRFTATGTMQPFGVPYTNTWIILFRFAGGQIVEEWWEFDLLGVQQQLGVMPPTRDTYTWGEPSAVTGEPGDPPTNKASVRRMIDEVFNGNLGVVDELFAPTYVMHDPAWPGEVKGPEGFKQWAGAMLEPYFADSHITSDMIAEGDKVAVRWTWSGTHTGEFMGIGVTGRRITVTGTSIHRFADGQFVESWASYDALGMMLQLTAEEWPVEAPGPEGISFVNIPAGTFEMGDHFDVGGGHERPVHTVTVSSFKLSKYEMTNAQYAEYLNAAMAYGLIKVVGNIVYASSDQLQLQYFYTSDADARSQIRLTGGRFSAGNRSGFSMADHPVIGITWYGAKAFCDYYGYRLPTEAEWEYAARGGFHAPYCRYPWGGNSISSSQLNFGFVNPFGLSGQPFTTRVDYYPAYGYGLCGMAGNVSEWCRDWWDADYYETSQQQDPQGPLHGVERVLRGGNWGLDALSCRVAGRGARDPSWHCPYGAAGFRAAQDMPGILPRRHPEPGLIVWWKLDEPEGAVAHDSTGDHDAVVTGDAVWQPDGGMVGGALELDGIDDSVRTNLILDPGDRPFSILVWIRGGAPGQVIVSQADGWAGRTKYRGCSWLAIDPVLGTLTTDVVGPEATASESEVVITDGQWHRVGLVRDASSRMFALYVDGVEVAAYVEPTLPTAYGGLQIGVGSGGEGGSFFSGLIDEVCIYNQAVTP